MTMPYDNVEDEYQAGYLNGKHDSSRKLAQYTSLESTSPHYVYGYDDGYNDVEPQQFTEEGPVADTQESEFDTVVLLIQKWNSYDLTRIAYWALDLIQETTNPDRYEQYLLHSAKGYIDSLQDAINNKGQPRQKC